MESSHSTRILRINEVKGATGLSRSTIYSWIKSGQFPTQVNLGSRSVGWRAHEVTAWIESRKSILGAK